MSRSPRPICSAVETAGWRNMQCEQRLVSGTKFFIFWDIFYINRLVCEVPRRKSVMKYFLISSSLPLRLTGPMYTFQLCGRLYYQRDGRDDTTGSSTASRFSTYLQKVP
jgi:hypothetical protein